MQRSNLHNGTVNVISARANFLLGVSDTALARKTVGKGKERKKNRERDTDRQTETDRQRQQTERHTDRQTLRQTQTV